MILLLSLYYVLVVPVRIAWPLEYYWPSEGIYMSWSDASWVLDKIFDVFFMFDIILSSKTIYEDHGRAVKDPSKIFWYYMTGSFAIDLVASVPFDWQEDIQNSYPTITIVNGTEVITPVDASSTFARVNKILRMLRLFKLARFARFSRFVEQFESGNYLMNPSSVRGMQSIVLLILQWHVLGCLYWYFAVTFGYNYLTVGEYHFCTNVTKLGRPYVLPVFPGIPATVTPNAPCCMRRPEAEYCYVSECLWYGTCSMDTITSTAPSSSSNSTTSTTSGALNSVFEIKDSNGTVLTILDYEHIKVSREDFAFKDINTW